MSDQAIYSWFDGDKRMSIYADGTVELQADGVSRRAPIDVWLAAAAHFNAREITEYRMRNLEP